MNRVKWLMVAAAAAIAAGAGIYLWKAESAPAVAYSEVKPERGEIELTITATGEVLPENRLEIKPPIAGRVDQVLVDEGAMVKKGQILAWMSSTERAALVDAARARGSEETKKWEEMYKPTPILAPIDGTIILRSIEPGQTFTGQDSLLVMSDRLKIKAQVDETDMAQVRLGQAARIVLDAYPGHTIPGRVDKIAYEATTISNVTSYLVDVLPGEIPRFMRSGMTANVTFVIESRKGVLTLPSNAVKCEKGECRVLVPAPDGRPVPEEKSVKTGIVNGKKMEIISGLSDGDTVLVQETKLSVGGTKKQTNPFAPTPPRMRRH